MYYRLFQYHVFIKLPLRFVILLWLSRGHPLSVKELILMNSPVNSLLVSKIQLILNFPVPAPNYMSGVPKTLVLT